MLWELQASDSGARFLQHQNGTSVLANGKACLKYIKYVEMGKQPYQKQNLDFCK